MLITLLLTSSLVFAPPKIITGSQSSSAETPTPQETVVSDIRTTSYRSDLPSSPGMTSSSMSPTSSLESGTGPSVEEITKRLELTEKINKLLKNLDENKDRNIRHQLDGMLAALDPTKIVGSTSSALPTENLTTLIEKFNNIEDSITKNNAALAESERLRKAAEAERQKEQEAREKAEKDRKAAEAKAEADRLAAAKEAADKEVARIGGLLEAKQIEEQIFRKRLLGSEVDEWSKIDSNLTLTLKAQKDHEKLKADLVAAEIERKKLEDQKKAAEDKHKEEERLRKEAEAKAADEKKKREEAEKAQKEAEDAARVAAALATSSTGIAPAPAAPPTAITPVLAHAAPHVAPHPPAGPGVQATIVQPPVTPPAAPAKAAPPPPPKPGTPPPPPPKGGPGGNPAPLPPPPGKVTAAATKPKISSEFAGKLGTVASKTPTGAKEKITLFDGATELDSNIARNLEIMYTTLSKKIDDLKNNGLIPDVFLNYMEKLLNAYPEKDMNKKAHVNESTKKKISQYFFEDQISLEELLRKYREASQKIALELAVKENIEANKKGLSIPGANPPQNLLNALPGIIVKSSTPLTIVIQRFPDYEEIMKNPLLVELSDQMSSMNPLVMLYAPSSLPSKDAKPSITVPKWLAAAKTDSDGKILKEASLEPHAPATYFEAVQSVDYQKLNGKAKENLDYNSNLAGAKDYLLQSLLENERKAAPNIQRFSTLQAIENKVKTLNASAVGLDDKLRKAEEDFKADSANFEKFKTLSAQQKGIEEANKWPQLAEDQIKLWVDQLDLVQAFFKPTYFYDYLPKMKVAQTSPLNEILSTSDNIFKYLFSKIMLNTNKGQELTIKLINSLPDQWWGKQKAAPKPSAKTAAP